MKKMMTNIKTLAALLMAGVAFAACSSSDDSIIDQPVNPTAPKTYTMTVQASKGDAAATRGLSLDGKTLNVKWNEGEEVIVMQGELPDKTCTYDSILLARSNMNSRCPS